LRDGREDQIDLARAWPRTMDKVATLNAVDPDKSRAISICQSRKQISAHSAGADYRSLICNNGQFSILIWCSSGGLGRLTSTRFHLLLSGSTNRSTAFPDANISSRLPVEIPGTRGRPLVTLEWVIMHFLCELTQIGLSKHDVGQNRLMYQLPILRYLGICDVSCITCPKIVSELPVTCSVI
jgi:hypothetical protein